LPADDSVLPFGLRIRCASARGAGQLASFRRNCRSRQSQAYGPPQACPRSRLNGSLVQQRNDGTQSAVAVRPLALRQTGRKPRIASPSYSTRGQRCVYFHPMQRRRKRKQLARGGAAAPRACSGTRKSSDGPELVARSRKSCDFRYGIGIAITCHVRPSRQSPRGRNGGRVRLRLHSNARRDGRA
jgi:hypothetical protein